MRSLLSLFFIVVLTVSASAQRVYFIYMQTDNYTPFYLKMGDKIYSSTNSGYLILPHLIDSTYNFSIGFPSSQVESKFTVSVNSKDKGFLIKNFNDGLGLFDLQTLSIIKAQTEQQFKNISYQKREDNFTTLLSKAANDTSLLYAVVTVKQDVVMKDPPSIIEEKKIEEPDPKKEEIISIKDTTIIIPPQKDNIAESRKEDEVLIEKKEEPKTIIKIDSTLKVPVSVTDTVNSSAPVSIRETEPYSRSVVKKHSESSTSEGFGLVYYDTDKGMTDTIRLLIPNPKFTLKQTDIDTPEQKQFIQPGDIKQDTVTQHTVVVTNNIKLPLKSSCKSVASDNDFFKLRKNMATKTTDETMIEEAKKVFKNRCFSTEQIKNLSALFLTSAGKYQFFDAAYLHVIDQEKFSSLASEIKDDYYLNRFKALIGE